MRVRKSEAKRKSCHRLGYRRRPDRRQSPAKPPHSLRLALEALEQRRLLSVSQGAGSGALTAFAASSLAFEPNVGQTDASVQYLARGNGYALFLTDTDAVLRLSQPANGTTGSSTTSAGHAAGTDSVVDIGIVGANPQPQITPLDPLASVTNYIGSSPAQSHAHVANYSRVDYHDIYPGIDLVYYGTQGQLEYDFVVAPGADPGAITLNVQGASSVTLDGQGNLVIHTSAGDVTEHAPVVYQEIDGLRQPVEGHYVLSPLGDSPAATQVRFQLGAYAPSVPLTIDPVLSYSTYFGGSMNDQGSGIAVDGKGNVYVTGWTESSNLPPVAVSGPSYQPSFTQGNFESTDAFVLKLDPTGKPVYFTYLGGNEDDSNEHTDSGGIEVGAIQTGVYGSSIAVDSQGRITVVGEVEQSPGADPNKTDPYATFPVTANALQKNPTYGQNGFLTRLTPDGSKPDYSTFINAASVGAPQSEDYAIASAVAVGPGDAVYASGGAASYGDVGEVSSRAFLVVINDDGSTRFAASYGGDPITNGYGIAVDTSGNAYITGDTNSSNFATTAPTGVTNLKGIDAYVLKIDPDPTVTSPLYAVRIGGSNIDIGNAIAVDAAGDAYVTGQTYSPDFPTVNAFQSKLANAKDPAVGFAGATDAFVTKLDPTGTKIIYSTYLGGSLDEQGNAIAVDPAGNAFVAGQTDSRDFPLVNPLHIPGGYGDTYGGGQNDAFITEFDPTGQNVLFSTYLGGGNHVFNRQVFSSQIGADVASSVAVDKWGNAWITGYAGSSDFPTSGSPVQSTFGGGPVGDIIGPSDAFIARLAPPLRVYAQGFSAQRNVSFTGVPVAVFYSPEANRSSSDFSATIDWGDGSSSAGSIVFDAASGKGTITGSHAYLKPGAFPVTVSVTDNVSGQKATAAMNVSQTATDASSPTIAVDPTNSNHLFVASDSATGGLFAATSNDGGQTWAPVDPVDQQIADGNDTPPLPAAFGDPQAVFDGFGNLFLSYIGADQSSVVVLLSKDGGRTFSVLENAPISGGAPGNPAVGVPKLSTGPKDAQGNRETWLVFKQKVKDVIDATEFMDTPAGQVTLVPFPTGNFLTLPNSSGTRDDVSVAVGPANQVLFAWQAPAKDALGNPVPGVDAISTVYLPAGSANPSAARVATFTSVAGTEMIPAQDEAGIDAEIGIAFDRSPDQYFGRAYLVYTDAAAAITDPKNPPPTNIFLQSSNDGGTTWTLPVAVNDDQAGPNQVAPAFNFLPSVAVDQKTGDVAVGWYDTRNDPNKSNVKTQFFVATSGDGGQTFSASRAASLGLSDATSTELDTSGRTNQYGPYSAIAFASGVVHPAWVDDSQELAIPGAVHFNLATASVAVASVKIPPPTLSPGQLQGVVGGSASGAVATINDPDPTATVDQFTNVNIDWGDGSDTTPGAVVQTGGAGTPFQVMGSHTYARAGVYPISVSLHDNASGADVSLSTDLLPRSPFDENSETVAVNPLNPMQIFIAANTNISNVGLFYATSTNGGMTWTPPQTLAAGGKDGLPLAYGDPQAAFDPAGRLFLGYLEQNQSVTAYVQSVDGGANFTLFNEHTVQGSLSSPVPSGSPRLATGPAPTKGQTALWELVKNNLADQIEATPWFTSGTVPPGGQLEVVPGSSGSFSFTPAIAVGPAGQTLVAFQKPSGTPGDDTIYTSLNSDGTTFGPIQNVASTGVVGQYMIPAQNTMGINSGLGLAWDLRNGPNGRVYLVYVDTAGAPGGKTWTTIKLQYSTDGGATWQVPVSVNDTPLGASAFLPSVAVDPTTGNVAVGWYDTRIDSANNVKTQFFVATSSNGGRSFSPGFVVSTAPSDATAAGLSDYAQQFQYGQYSGLAYQGGLLYPVWADDSSSLNSQGSQPHFDVWAARLGTANIADAPFSATGTVATATENVQFTATTVATLSDPNVAAAASDFTATIDWGDGSTSTATGGNGLIVQTGPGAFNVLGTHKYTAEKVYPVKVSISDIGGATATASSTVAVTDPPPQTVPQQAQFTALQNVPTGMRNLALFTIDSDDESAPGENHTYHYSINWDDGTPPDTGTATPVGSGVTVRASHAFKSSGTLHPVVTLTDEHEQSGTATATAVVSSDVTGSIGTDSSGLVYNAQTQLDYGQITITNTGAGNITGPLPVVISGLPAGVTLANATGTDGAGAPYITAPINVLAPGQSTSITVQFSDPTQAAINYTVNTFDPAPVSPLQLVSVTDPNLISASGDDSALDPSVSADGRYVAFLSEANNLLVNSAINSGPPGATPEIYVRDTVAGTLTLASVGANGATVPAGELGSLHPFYLSPDGRYLLFASGSGDYLRDLVANTTRLFSVDMNGNPTTSGFSFYNNPFSADSRYVVFMATSYHNPSDLVTNDKVGGYQVFVRDLQTGTTTLVTVNTSGTDAGNADTSNYGGVYGNNFDPTISADGRYVAFESDSNNLVTNDAIGGTQVFVRDVQQGVTTMVSVNAAGTDGGNDQGNNFNSDNELPQISADGGTVVFQSVSTNLLPSGVSDLFLGHQQLFARNLLTNTTSLVSVDPNGVPLAAAEYNNFPVGFVGKDITPDGRYIAFTCDDGSGSGLDGVYVRDVQAGKTVLASVNAAGTANGNQGAAGPLSLSADGRFVLFASASTDLVSNDKVGGGQWFVRDLQQNQTTLVSVNRDGTDAGDTGVSGDTVGLPTFSSDGRFVTFVDAADNLVAGDYNFTNDIFQRDLQSATTLLVSARDPNLPSVADSEVNGNRASSYPSVSADGRYVVFASQRADLLPNLLLPPTGDNTLPGNIYVRDLQTGTTTLVSIGLDGQSANSDCTQPVISANGRYVLFASQATNLTANPTGSATANVSQLFVRDLVAGTTTLVSVDLSGAWCGNGVYLGTPSTLDDPSRYQATISDDGRYVAFESMSDDLTSISKVRTSGYPNLYVRDLVTGTTTLASISADGSSGANYGVDNAEISGNGTVVVFTSLSSNLINGVAPPANDNLFVRNLQQGTTSLVNVNTQGTADDNGAITLIGPNSISDDGRYVTFLSGSSDLVAGQQDPSGGNFLRDLQQGVTTLVSAPAGSTPPIISSNGEAVVFNGSKGAVYEWNRTTGSTTLVNPTTSGQPALAGDVAALSADGRFVLYVGTAANPITGAATYQQLYLRDVQQGVTTLISRAPDGSGANNGPTPNILNYSGIPSLSADGSTAVFDASAATNLVPDTFNWDQQVYAYQATPDLPLTAQAAAVSATENAAFQGLVATFVDADPTGVVGDYSATIDWGDGSTSAGSVAADANVAGQFDVTGSHTYAEEGAFAVVVSIVDQGGATATAATTVVAEPVGGAITYRRLTFDTSALKGTNGTLALQFNPGELPGAQPATATVSSLVVSGGSTSGAPTTLGGASLAADGSFQLVNSGTLNELLLPLTYGDTVSFDLTLSGAAVAQPGGGSIGNAFAVQLLGTDGLTPQSTTEPDGAAMTTDLAPDGTATANSFLTSSTGKALAIVPNVADAPVAAQGGFTITTMAGASFTGQTVATFTDPAGAEPLANYSATIEWGDGSSSAGTILPSNVNGTFTVQGSHSYNSAGNDAIAVTIQHDTAPNVTVTSTANVAAVVQPSLTVAAQSVSGSEGASLANSNVATFTLAGASATASNFSAAVNWGDGSSTPATVAARASGGFDVNGSHTYAEEGSYTFTVLVQYGTVVGSATGTANVADQAVAAQGGFTLTAAAGTSSTSQTAATFKDPGGLEPLADYSATIDWGDGTSSAGTILPADANGTFTVQGSHSYNSAGNDAIAVAIQHDTAPNVTVTSTANVAAVVHPSLTVAAQSVSGSEGASLANSNVATFTLAGASATASDFSATVNWGDGSSAPATVAAGASGGFDVNGSHIYAEEGSYTFTVMVQDGSVVGSATGTANVADQAVAAQGGFTLTAAAGTSSTSQTVATFKDRGGVEPMADYSATIDWGDGASSAGTIMPADANGTFTVQGSHSYAAAGTDAIIITIHHDTAPDATATSTATVSAATSTGQPGIAATSIAVTAYELTGLTGANVATFSDADGSLSAADFSATIDWGDGTTSPGSVTVADAGNTGAPHYTVSGSHEYVDEGHFTVKIQIAQTAGAAALTTSATVTATATVHEQPLEGIAVGTPDQYWIQEIYRDLFNRQAEPQGRDYWVSLLSQGQSRQQVAFDIVKLAYPREFQHDTVDALYAQYLGRAADPQGKDYWTAFLYDGGTIEEMSQALCSSPEFYRLHGAAAKGLIDALYQDALGRAADTAGEAYWEQQMTHGMTQASLAAAFFSSDEYLRLRAGVLYEQLLDEPINPASAEQFAQQLAHGTRDEQIIGQLISSDEYFAKSQI